MKYLKIRNKGELDIRLVGLMGGTTKSNDEYKIGQFGTGLKYTLAYLFRENLSFRIFVGANEVKLHVETEVIRDNPFDIICINDNRTSITTMMGEDWEAWMIIRELWCNALDEGEATHEITSEVNGVEGTTTFYVQVTSTIQEVIDDWDKFFIHGRPPMFKNDLFSIYPGGKGLCIFKQGVLVYRSEETKSLFHYDFHNAQINELREYRDSIEVNILEALAKIDDERIVRYFFDNISDAGLYEGTISTYYSWIHFNDVYKNVLGGAKLITQKSVDALTARGIPVDVSSMVMVPDNFYKMLTRHFDGIGATQIAAQGGEFYEIFHEECEMAIKKALTILEHCNYFMHPELTFVYGFFDDKRINARISISEKKIYMDNKLVGQSLFKVIAIIVEENEHFVTGLSDETRDFQQHFIDLYTKLLLKLHNVEI